MAAIFQDLFELRCIVDNVTVRLSCRIESGVKRLIALVTSNEDVLLYYTYGELPAVVKRIPWFTENSKIIQAVCFDPTATWLLCVSVDGSLYILPALSLVDKKQKIDCKWSVTDLTCFPKQQQMPDAKPLSVVWWQTLDSNQNALVGYENGAVGLISLTDGRCIGVCNVNESITQLSLCQDNSLDTVSLLINGENGQQWRMILEQHSTGYLWPPEMNNQDDSSKGRLQSLKQMGADKLASLKQRIAEARGSRRDSQTSDTASESSHSESIHSGPELLPHLCDTYFAPQYARNRYLLSAFYKPTSLLTVHTVDVETAPLYVHKLSPNTHSVLLTDRLIYTINEDLNRLSVLSSQFSECRLEGDSEFNPNSLVAFFDLQNPHEKIINMYKCTDLTIMKEKRTNNKDKDAKTYTLPKSVAELNLRKPKVDTCILVTNTAVYKVILKCSPVVKFVQLVTETSDLEKAEKLSLMFGLNLQQLLESCGDILIANGSFHSGLILYKQAKVHLLKRVLKLAVSADCRALLKFVNLCLSASKVDMSMPTKIHIGNLAVMAYTELILRHGGPLRVINTKEFMNFLCYEEFYDQVLAVNVACQASLWSVVSLLANSRGIQPEVVTAISQILQTTRAPSCNDKDFLQTVTDPCLVQSLLIYPGCCQIILNYIRTYLENFSTEILYRLLLQLDPSQPSVLPLTTRLFQRYHHSSSLDSTLDSVDFDNPDRSVITIKDILETFIHVLIVYVKKTGFHYDLELLEKNPQPGSPIEEPNIKNFPDLNPISCGYEHAAIARNNAAYTMGVTSGGCLGLGPMLTQSSTPKVVQTLVDLKVKVLTVSCGRKHTLFLTDCGVYSCGSNFYGQLGLGRTIQESPYPQTVTSLIKERIVGVSSGQYHSLALTACGKVYSWGWGIHGQLGHGSCDNEYYPKLLTFKHKITQIAAGHAHSLILTCDGKLFGFGSNAFGQLETCNIEGTKTTSPVWVLIMPDMYIPIEKIATAYFHNIAVRADQEVYTWGASPQEVRLSQSKNSQKLNGIGLKSCTEPWKSSVHIYSSFNRKPIEQVAVGYRHTAILHNGKILWGRNRDGELSPPRLIEQDNLTIFNQRFLNISCGLDYTMALEQSGRVLAWGSYTMAQTILGRPLEEDKKLDGKVVIFKNTKRIVKFPNALQNNTEGTPIEVPGLPTMAISYNTCDYRTLTRSVPPYAIRSIENDTTKSTHCNDKTLKFGQKTLHYVLESYFGNYDTESVLSKCIDVDNYQAASKIAILDGHYTDSLGFQLSAFKKHMESHNLKIVSNNKFEELNEKDLDRKNSPARILSTSSSLDSIRQWGDDLEHQGGRESPCDFSEMGDIRQNINQYVRSVKNDNTISSVSDLISETNKTNRFHLNEIDSYIDDEQTKEIILTAAHLIEFYIEKTYASENHILMQNILLKCIEFWLGNNLPVVILENVLLKNMDKYFYPLSILLFCKNFNNNFGEEILKDNDDIKQDKSAGFLKEFSTKFCLQLCSMVLENVNKA